MDALLVRIGSGRDGHMVAIKVLHRVRVVDGPHRLLGLVHEYRCRTHFLDALLHAGRTRPGVLGAAHRVGDPAVDFGRVGGAGRDRGQAKTSYQQGYYTLHEKPPGDWEFSIGFYHAPFCPNPASKMKFRAWGEKNTGRALPVGRAGCRGGLPRSSAPPRSAGRRLKNGSPAPRS